MNFAMKLIILYQNQTLNKLTLNDLLSHFDYFSIRIEQNPNFEMKISIRIDRKSMASIKMHLN
jgi:hypothetical protein